ncbi:MAG: cobalt ECF transporter T component CbiQ [Candidatus Tectomicrobia bacterium]|uniref:Cobalt ECF transporter T component CbiQ n=1 Tax=Tectimicrobiota bacterium TaxID=2528274 RepID=A0A933GK69_UNCTE|nr:cobalt ECF transporter T component CbiQ [Candidatus Tectomicrobia bacterium]
MTFDTEFFNLGYLDTLSYRDTFIHRLDPRVKLVVTSIFTITVVSFPKYEVSGLIPYFLFPVLLFVLGDIPLRFILKKILTVSPFAFFLGIFNPIIDTHVIYILYGIPISGGWISLLSIILKFFLTISAALLLIATTSFPGICSGLRRLGLPDIFVSQLLFLYRYIFVLMEETMKMVRARDMRSFGKNGSGIKIFVNLIGVLFIRTVERSERIYQAMLSRGFKGKVESSKIYRISGTDIVFTMLALAVFYLFRKYRITGMFGKLLI